MSGRQLAVGSRWRLLRSWYVRAAIAAGLLLFVSSVVAVARKGKAGKATASRGSRSTRATSRPTSRRAGADSGRLSAAGQAGTDGATAGLEDSATRLLADGEEANSAESSAAADEDDWLASEGLLGTETTELAADSAPAEEAEDAVPGIPVGEEWEFPETATDSEPLPEPEYTEIAMPEEYPPAITGVGEETEVARVEEAQEAPREDTEVPSAPTEDRLERVEKELTLEEGAEIEPLALRFPTVFDLAEGQRQFAVRATPDGLVEFLGVNVPVDVAVVGAKGNEVNFSIQSGEEISAWPVSLVTVSPLDDRFTVIAATVDWAFAVRADSVRRGGLPTRCDDVSCVLLDGDRIDTDRFGNRVVLRVVGPDWPGSLVRLLAKRGARASDQRVARTRSTSLEEMYLGPVKPGVFADSSRDFPWQSVPLPVIDR